MMYAQIVALIGAMDGREKISNIFPLHALNVVYT